MASIASRNLTSALLSHAPNGSTKIHQVPMAHRMPILQNMKKNGGIKCNVGEEKAQGKSKSIMISSGESIASVTVAAVAAAMANVGPAMALVDERLSTEGTGLPFGLSNNLLGWILFVGFGVIWALYFVYASSLEEDEDSGLSL